MVLQFSIGQLAVLDFLPRVASEDHFLELTAHHAKVDRPFLPQWIGTAYLKGSKVSYVVTLTLQYFLLRHTSSRISFTV